MASTGDRAPAGAAKQNEQEQELRIDELPAESTSKEQEDALRGGLTTRGGDGLYTATTDEGTQTGGFGER